MSGAEILESLTSSETAVEVRVVGVDDIRSLCD
jgi:hypothetical protein